MAQTARRVAALSLFASLVFGAVLGVPQPAGASTDVTVSAAPDEGGTFVGGIWTPNVADPDSSNISSQTVDTALNSGTNVTITTDSGVAGDGSITLLDPLDQTLSGGDVLTFDAANNVYLGASVLLEGPLVVNPDQVTQADQSGTGVIYLQNTSPDDPCATVCPITTTGDQTYNGTVILGEDTPLTTSASLNAQAIELGPYSLTVSDGGSSTISGVISGAGGLTQSGTGTLTLSADNTYSGQTTVSSGTLNVTGTVGGDVAIASGATLAGNGTIEGSVTQQAGGILAPGSGIGTLNVGGGYTWNGSTGATADFELSNTSSSSDQLAILGALSEGSGSNFEFNFGGTGEAGTTYTLATFASTTFSASDFSYTNLAPGLIGAFSIVNGDTLQFTAGYPLSISQPANITTNATSPSGATVTYPLPTVTDPAVSSPPAPSCAPPSGSVFPIGATKVTCTASDADDIPSTVSSSFTVTVLGAAAQLESLDQAVQGVGTGKLLAATVGLAEQQLAAGHPFLACLTLVGFVLEVRLETSHPIPPSTAAELIADAKQIMAVVAC